ncbi:MAG: hypothetical protein LBT53_08300 [Puniceicoccales bacterium]|nr:hypothetical protein [Puniceicoccales bacterium]
MNVLPATRPATLAEIARRSDSLEAFGRHFRDWLHEVAKWSSRKQAVCAVAQAPRPLATRFSQGKIADAWLAAYAEFICEKCGQTTPEWTFSSDRFLAETEPWFSVPRENSRARLLTLRDTPAAFKRRNLFTAVVELPLRFRAGRPRKTLAEKRHVNALRQKRFRLRQKRQNK